MSGHCTGTKAHRAGFSLIETLIAMVILGIGLIGLAAIFPAVIAQQKQATDLSVAVTAARNAESVLGLKFARFGAAFEDVPNRPEAFRWYRVNVAEPTGDYEQPFLRMPPSQRGIDFRIEVQAKGAMDPEQFSQGSSPNIRQYDRTLVPSPISDRSPDSIVVRISAMTTGGYPELIVLRPEGAGGTRFYVAQGAPNRLSTDPSDVNVIDYNTGRIAFPLNMTGLQTVLSVRFEYLWLDDRLVAHRDRLYPTVDRSELLDETDGEPRRVTARYGWDVAVRKAPSGGAEYALFVYRFDGPVDQEFVPEIPSSYTDTDTGMLRRGRARLIESNGRYYLQVQGDMAEHLDVGSWVLAENAVAPVRVRRKVAADDGDEDRWELEAPPMEIRIVNGERLAVPIRNGAPNFWYLPSSFEVDSGDGTVTWKIKPLMAYVKPVGG